LFAVEQDSPAFNWERALDGVPLLQRARPGRLNTRITRIERAMKHSLVTSQGVLPVGARHATMFAQGAVRRVLGLAAALAAGLVQAEDLGDGRPTIEEARLGEGAPAAVST
jgi:hypothetical protein